MISECTLVQNMIYLGKIAEDETVLYFIAVFWPKLQSVCVSENHCCIVNTLLLSWSCSHSKKTGCCRVVHLFLFVAGSFLTICTDNIQSDITKLTADFTNVASVTFGGKSVSWLPVQALYNLSNHEWHTVYYAGRWCQHRRVLRLFSYRNTYL